MTPVATCWRGIIGHDSYPHPYLLIAPVAGAIEDFAIFWCYVLPLFAVDFLSVGHDNHHLSTSGYHKKVEPVCL